MDSDTDLVEGLLNAYRILKENSMNPPNAVWRVVVNRDWQRYYWSRMRHGRRFQGRYLQRWTSKTDDDYFAEYAMEFE